MEPRSGEIRLDGAELCHTFLPCQHRHSKCKAWHALSLAPRWFQLPEYLSTSSSGTCLSWQHPCGKGQSCDELWWHPFKMGKLRHKKDQVIHLRSHRPSVVEQGDELKFPANALITGHFPCRLFSHPWGILCKHLVANLQLEWPRGASSERPDQLHCL